MASIPAVPQGSPSPVPLVPAYTFTTHRPAGQVLRHTVSTNRLQRCENPLSQFLSPLKEKTHAPPPLRHLRLLLCMQPARKQSLALLVAFKNYPGLAAIPTPRKDPGCQPITCPDALGKQECRSLSPDGSGRASTDTPDKLHRQLAPEQQRSVVPPRCGLCLRMGS